MRILLGVDSTPASQIAVAEVATRPWPPRTSVELVSVVDLTYSWNAPEFAGAVMQSADDALRCASQQLRLAGIQSTSTVLTGDPKDVMVDYASQTGADLVVVGSHDASDVVRFLLGSVARAMVRFAPSSVEVVRPRATEGAMKVLLATDGSDCSLSAARSVVSRPWPLGTEFRVISVVELAPAWFRTPYPAYFDSQAMEELRGEAMKHAQDAVAAAEKILSGAGLAESGTVVIPAASAKEMILNQAAEWGADLIVLGSHGRRGASRFMLGSVSEPVAFHAACSVEIVRARQ
jgi:nucleotide-binding universal stress UspA family protein